MKQGCFLECPYEAVPEAFLSEIYYFKKDRPNPKDRLPHKD